jgi:hypothetical protein
MSSRPKRVRQEPERLQQNNWRETETRKKAKKSTGTQKPTGTKTPAKTRGEKRKREPGVNIFNVLNRVGSGTKNIKAFNMLYSIYKDTSAPKLSKTISSLNNKSVEELITKQYEILNKNIRRNGIKNTLNLKLSEIDKLDFCLLIWLDMRHDAKTSTSDSMKNVSFEKFLNSEDSPLKMIIENPPTFQMTDLMNKMIQFKIISKDLKSPGPSNWERRIKDNLPELFGIKKPNKISSQKVYGFDAENPINISIDSEGSQSAISTLIAYNRKEQPNGTTRYPIRSIITIANRVDPGNTMPTGGVQQEWTKLFNNSGDLKSTQIYNVSDCEFKIGDTKLELTSGTKGTFNMTVNGEPIKVGSTAANVRPINKNNLLSTDNRGRFPAQAIYKLQKPQKNELRVSKFLGDFMQILTVCSEPQSGKVTAFGTLDGVASGIYTFISKRLMKQEPRLFIDMYIDQGNYIDVYGFSHLLNKNNNRLKPQQAQSVINTYKGINGNTRNNASSSRSRNNGSSNGNGSGTIRAASVSNGNNTITANSGSNRNGTIRATSASNGNSTNTNMVQPLRKKQKPSNNTSSLASAIRNNKNNKNNNNEVTSGFAKMRNLKPKFVMGTKPETKKKPFFPFPVRKVTKPQTTVLNPKRRTRNNNNNNKLTPKKPKTIARAELNKLTSLSRNQKINYLEKIKRDPTNILRILSNARRVANSQRPPRQ